MTQYANRQKWESQAKCLQKLQLGCSGTRGDILVICVGACSLQTPQPPSFHFSKKKNTDSSWVFFGVLVTNGFQSSCCSGFYSNHWSKKKNDALLLKSRQVLIKELQSDCISVWSNVSKQNTNNNNVISITVVISHFNASCVEILPRNNWRSVSGISISHYLSEHCDH